MGTPCAEAQVAARAVEAIPTVIFIVVDGLCWRRGAIGGWSSERASQTILSCEGRPFNKNCSYTHGLVRTSHHLHMTVKSASGEAIGSLRELAKNLAIDVARTELSAQA